MTRPTASVREVRRRAGLWIVGTTVASAAAAALGTSETHPEPSLLAAIGIGALIGHPRALTAAPALIPLSIGAAVAAAWLDLSPVVGGAAVVGALIGKQAHPVEGAAWPRAALGAALATVGVAVALGLAATGVLTDAFWSWVALGAAVGAGASLAGLAPLFRAGRAIPNRLAIALALPRSLRARPMRAATLARAIPVEPDGDPAAALARRALGLARELKRLDAGIALVGAGDTAELRALRRQADRTLDEILRALEVAAATSWAERCRHAPGSENRTGEALAEVHARVVERTERARAWAEVNRAR